MFWTTLIDWPSGVFGPNGFYDHYELYAIYITDKPNPDSDSLLGGLLPVEQVWAPIGLDVGFGLLQLPRLLEKSEPLETHPTVLRPAPPLVGEVVTAIGYSNMKASICYEGEQYRITYAQERAEVRGTVVSVRGEKRERGLLSFPCFCVDADYKHGMSGGPISTHADEYAVSCRQVIILVKARGDRWCGQFSAANSIFKMATTKRSSW